MGGSSGDIWASVHPAPQEYIHNSRAQAKRLVSQGNHGNREYTNGRWPRVRAQPSRNQIVCVQQSRKQAARSDSRGHAHVCEYMSVGVCGGVRPVCSSLLKACSSTLTGNWIWVRKVSMASTKSQHWMRAASKVTDMTNNASAKPRPTFAINDLWNIYTCHNSSRVNRFPAQNPTFNNGPRLIPVAY